MERTAYPIEFVDQIKKLLPGEYQDFFTALSREPTVSIQLNKGKTFGVTEKEKGVPWYKEGIYLKKRPIFTLDPILHCGGYYVQEASSMLVGAVVQQYLGDGRKVRALDLCAAPGGKSLLLADSLSQQSVVVSNEIIRNRLMILRENIIKRGYINYSFGNFDANYIAQNLPDYFDLILVDAPCSGEGLFRKSPEAVEEWSVEHVRHCSLRQRRILSDAVAALAPGGILIYSTCTYNDQEDRQNADWMVKEFALTPLLLDIQDDWGLTEVKFDQSTGYYCFPHKVAGEGFFMSIFQKKGDSPDWPLPNKKQGHFRKLTPLVKDQVAEMEKWVKMSDTFAWYNSPKGQVIGIPKDQLQQYLLLDHRLAGIQFGILAGEFKGKAFIPSPELALSTALSPAIPDVELDKEQALAFLRKAPLHLPTAPKGWVLARYQGLGLGWMKVLPNRTNNYWPTNWRIRM